MRISRSELNIKQSLPFTGNYKEAAIIALQLNDLSLRDITAPSLLTDEGIKGVIYALDPELKAITASIPEALLLSRIDELPESILDALAWQFHADYYDLAADINMKREHVRSVIRLHQKKGTVWAIREALRLMDIEAEFVPWWQTGDNPYTFRLRAVIGGDYYRTRGREALMRNLRRAVDDTKSARSYMTQAEAFLYDSEHQELYAGVKGSIGGNSLIRIAPPESIDDLALTAGVLPLTGGAVRIRNDYPESAGMNIFAGVVSMSENGVSISPDLSEIERLLKGFEERIYIRLDLCEHNIIIPAMDMMRRVQRLDDFIHDYSPKTLFPSLKAGVVSLAGGTQRIRTSLPDEPVNQRVRVGTLPLTSGSITIRNALPESTSLMLKTALTGAYGLDIYLGMAHEEHSAARQSVFSRANSSEGYIYTGWIMQSSGDISEGLRYQDESMNTALALGVSGAFGLDEYIFIGDDVLQELLLQFEQRIFARIDEHEAKEDKAIEELSERLARLERLIEPED